jgi:hypothetical protein
MLVLFLPVKLIAQITNCTGEKLIVPQLGYVLILSTFDSYPRGDFLFVTKSILRLATLLLFGYVQTLKTKVLISLFTTFFIQTRKYFNA